MCGLQVFFSQAAAFLFTILMGAFTEETFLNFNEVEFIGLNILRIMFLTSCLELFAYP